MTSRLGYGPVYHNDSEWPTHIWVGRPSGGEIRCYVEQRTCRNELDEGSFGCSVCGCHVRNLPFGSTYVRDGKRWYSLEKRTLNYCPHCGAKVVSE